MKFGIHSLLFSETFLEQDLPLLDKAKDAGFDALEIIPFDPDHFPASQVGQRAANLGLDIYTGIGLPANANPISPDPAVRAAALRYSKRLIDLSAECGSKGYGGVNYCGWGYLTGKMRTSDEWAWAVEHYRALAEYAIQASPGLFLAIEPVNRFESHLINIAADAVSFCQEVGLPNVKVHLDTFHMIREEDNFAKTVNDTGPYLGYIHACENQRGIPGRGQVPWLDFFRALKSVNYQGCITIESFDPNMPNIARLCCIWRKLADSPEQLASDGLSFLRGVLAQVEGARL
jgi:D-psicose/D-tagatose/L-ribulose 3-epimerase